MKGGVKRKKLLTSRRDQLFRRREGSQSKGDLLLIQGANPDDVSDEESNSILCLAKVALHSANRTDVKMPKSL
ncbi:hypothetical protein OJAV_G00143080 [Oryzias javanicus]|uniref:Uncharacterized protein n=1 Tax=Oryzias javanicus TaxID=123683 RepID=A0A3S2P4F5_ORYJA|nr:hypothetical protein OJAV_G00143080 [Oryzias javanicus]